MSGSCTDRATKEWIETGAHCVHVGQRVSRACSIDCKCARYSRHIDSCPQCLNHVPNGRGKLCAKCKSSAAGARNGD